MESSIEIFYKGILSITILFIFTKIMGKKQVGQLNMFDYIVGITIGSIAAEMTMNKDISIMDGTIGIAVYSLIACIISIVTMKSIIARRLLIGTPCTIIQNGKILEKSLKKSKIDINDLLQEARNNGYFDISEIEYAIMEGNGRLSFLPKSKYVPLTPNDMKIKTDYKGLCNNLIIDSKIMKEHLKNIKKDEQWLKKRLEKLGYENIDNILLATIDSKEKITIFEKNNNLKEERTFE